MNKICTDIEQSKKLIELGIDVNTADMLWTYDFTVNDINGLNVISKHLKPEKKDVPAWSLSALSELMPLINEYNVEYRPIIERYKDDGWACKYYNEETRSTDDVYIRRYGRTPLDAAFDMVVWLKENNKL